MGRSAWKPLTEALCVQCSLPFQYKQKGTKQVRKFCCKQCQWKAWSSAGAASTKVRPHKPHPQSKTHPIHVTEYWAWKNMLQRCTNPKNSHYHRYGGRGIIVCDRWRKFDAFLADMGPKPSPDLTLERENNDGNYEPSNCVWANWEAQYANRKQISPKVYKVGTEQLTEHQIGERLGIEAQTVGGYRRRGVSHEELLTCGIPSAFNKPLTRIWPYPDRDERHRLIMLWRKLDIPLRVCGELLGMTRERVWQIEAMPFHNDYASYGNGRRKIHMATEGRKLGRPRKTKPYSGLDDESLLSLGMS